MTEQSEGKDCAIDRGPGLLVSCWVEATLAILVVGARFWTQRSITRHIGWDDWCMLFGLVVGLLNTSLITQSIANGLGQHWACLAPDRRMRAQKWEYIAQPAGIMSPAISRIAFCLYLLKFTGTDKRKRYLFLFIIITQLLVNLATLIEVLVSCDRYAILWDKDIKGRCWSPMIQAYLGFFQGAWNSTTDLVLSLLPFLIIKNLNMKLQTRIALSILLGLSIIAMIACIIKTIELRALGNPVDFTMSTVGFVIWFTIEQYVIIIVASVPTLRPLAVKLSKQSTFFKHVKECWRLSDSSNTGSESRTRVVKLTLWNQSHPIECESSWPPTAIRLNTQRSYDKLELEPPYFHSPPKDTPPAGTIRKTISVYIRPASPSREHFVPIFESAISASGHTYRSTGRPQRQSISQFDKNEFDDVELQ